MRRARFILSEVKSYVNMCAREMTTAFVFKSLLGCPGENQLVGGQRRLRHLAAVGQAGNVVVQAGDVGSSS